MTKSLSSALFLLLLAFGAGAQTPERNKATLLRMANEVFSQGKLEVVDQICTPAVIDHNAPSPNLPAGIPGVKATVLMFRTAFPDLSMQQVDALVDGNKITQRWVMRGTMTGPFLGNAPTGKTFAIEGIDIVQFDAQGYITDRWGQCDVLGMLAQLGLQK